ncbi:MAG: UDP-N-acetylmuramate--L-alanine ligase [Deltaproteobacteria bacterium]|nr:UDP-N-acetylmuramate--L-alanine ligase [Deltaproteobacteria bacterium]
MKTEINLNLNTVPDNVRHVHLMGICGTGMVSLAGILKEKGYHVTGSDQNLYPPISLFLEDLSITPFKGYRPENLHPRPDLVVVGNVITRNNPEAEALADLEIPFLSFPQALKHFAFKGKKNIVIAGTHGKTTTSSIVAWMLEASSLEPGFMIGGIPKNFKRNFKLGRGPYFVIEGDEYDTAFFDKGPKFLHYRPWITILTSVEFDHADIYRDLDHVISSFKKLVSNMQDNGTIIANVSDPVVASLVKDTRCNVITYGADNSAMWHPGNVSFDDVWTILPVLRDGKEAVRIETSLYGRHNCSNLVSAIALAHFLEIPWPKVQEAIRSFTGVKRRQDRVGEKKGILVIDDFAHHPTAVKETVSAVKERFPERRLIAVFEPRSNSSRRNVFQKRYATSFDMAETVMLSDPFMPEKIPPEKRFSSAKLASDLKRKGIRAFHFPDTDKLLNALVEESSQGDVVLFMSNGPFDNLPERFLKAI